MANDSAFLFFGSLKTMFLGRTFYNHCIIVSTRVKTSEDPDSFLTPVALLKTPGKGTLDA